MLFNIVFAIYFLFCVTVILGGYFILSIYKGYLHSKNKELDISTQSEIEKSLFVIAGFPIVIICLFAIVIAKIPFWTGQIIGKIVK